MVKALRYKPAGRGFDSRWCNWNVAVLLRFIEQRNMLQEIGKRKANWIGHILRRNCLLKQVIEGKIKGEMEVTRRSTGPIM